MAYGYPLLAAHLIEHGAQTPPLKIELLLQSNYSYFSGTYLQGTGLINEKPFWLQQNGSHAIWYQSYISDWIIGDVTNLGKYLGDIYISDEKNHLYPNASIPVTFKNIGMHNFEIKQSNKTFIS